jgi:hypothetical protein
MSDSVIPNRFHGSMTFSPKVTTYDLLAQRVRRAMGEPLIQIEISSEQIYENIDIACEWFTKFSGITEEYLIFRSDLYTTGVGLRIDKLINITPDLYNSTDFIDNKSDPNYKKKTPNGTASAYYTPSVPATTFTPPPSAFPNSLGWDYDMNQYRKVIDVFSYEQGNNSGVNTLFTIENTIAQQAYFGNLLGNVGYDLITWQALKTWIDTREKVLALKPFLRFYPETQILKIIPEPNQLQSSYYGLVGCYIQKAIKDIVSQLWVYRYVLALCKINVAHARGKYSGTILFGGQQVNYADLMRQGEAEKDALEKEMSTMGADLEPPKFFLG